MGVMVKLDFAFRVWGVMDNPILEHYTLILVWFLVSYHNNLYLKRLYFSPGVYSKLGTNSP